MSSIMEVFVSIQETGYDKLSASQRRLVMAASRAMNTAYRPYSKFSVGAALLSASGKIITGSNFENAAYGSTICAERAAIVRANSQRIRKVLSLAVIVRKGESLLPPSAPCGSCRQVIFELSQLSGRDIEIIMSSTDRKTVRITTIGQLLPLAFGPLDLFGEDGLKRALKR